MALMTQCGGRERTLNQNPESWEVGPALLLTQWVTVAHLSPLWASVSPSVKWEEGDGVDNH